jgi:hypothetical protein
MLAKLELPTPPAAELTGVALLRHILQRLRSGAYPTKNYKYWFTNICNYKYL